MKKNWKMWLGGLVMVTLILGGGAGYYLMQQNQDVRQQAAGCSYWCSGCGGFCGTDGVRAGKTCNQQVAERCGSGSQQTTQTNTQTTTTTQTNTTTNTNCTCDGWAACGSGPHCNTQVNQLFNCSSSGSWEATGQACNTTSTTTTTTTNTGVGGTSNKNAGDNCTLGQSDPASGGCDGSGPLNCYSCPASTAKSGQAVCSYGTQGSGDHTNACGGAAGTTQTSNECSPGARSQCGGPGGSGCQMYQIKTCTGSGAWGGCVNAADCSQFLPPAETGGTPTTIQTGHQCLNYTNGCTCNSRQISGGQVCNADGSGTTAGTSQTTIQCYYIAYNGTCQTRTVEGSSCTGANYADPNACDAAVNAAQSSSTICGQGATSCINKSIGSSCQTGSETRTCYFTHRTSTGTASCDCTTTSSSVLPTCGTGLTCSPNQLAGASACKDGAGNTAFCCPAGYVSNGSQCVTIGVSCNVSSTTACLGKRINESCFVDGGTGFCASQSGGDNTCHCLSANAAINTCYDPRDNCAAKQVTNGSCTSKGYFDNQSACSNTLTANCTSGFAGCVNKTNGASCNVNGTNGRCDLTSSTGHCQCTSTNVTATAGTQCQPGERGQCGCGESYQQLVCPSSGANAGKWTCVNSVACGYGATASNTGVGGAGTSNNCGTISSGTCDANCNCSSSGSQCIAIHQCNPNQGTGVECTVLSPEVRQGAQSVDAQALANQLCKCVQVDVLNGENGSCVNGHINGDPTTMVGATIACPTSTANCTTPYSPLPAGQIPDNVTTETTTTTGPQCLNITMSKTNPQMGDQVTFTCGEVAGAARYVFRVKHPSGAVDILTATGRVSQPLNITAVGTYYAQCQICTGADDSTCHPFEYLAQ